MNRLRAFIFAGVGIVLTILIIVSLATSGWIVVRVPILTGFDSGLASILQDNNLRLSTGIWVGKYEY